MSDDRTIPRPERRPPPSGDDGRVVFHYNRSEREALRESSINLQRGPLLRRSRSLALLLIDAVIVTALFGIYIIFLRPMADRVELAGYAADPETAIVASDFVISVELRPTADAQLPPPLATLRAAGGELVDLAPRPGTTRALRLRVPIAEAEGSVDPEGRVPVFLSVGDESHTFALPIEN